MRRNLNKCIYPNCENWALDKPGARFCLKHLWLRIRQALEASDTVNGRPFVLPVGEEYYRWTRGKQGRAQQRERRRKWRD